MSMRVALAWGMLAAMLAALPSALRLAPESVWPGFLVLSGATALLLAPFTASLAARSTLSGLSRILALGVGIALLPLTLAGRVLKSTTHHRPLGGATFAVVAVCVLLAGCALSARVLSWASTARSADSRWAARATLGFCVALAIFAVIATGFRVTMGEVAQREGVFDAARALGFGVAAAWLPAPRAWARSLGSIAVVAWLCVVSFGAWLSRGPALSAELSARTPVLYAPLSWLGG
jgi:hypothetical protein